MHLYTGVVLHLTEAEAFVHTYWARPSDVGAAVEQILDAARANGVKNPRLLSLDLFDIDDLPTDVIPSPQANTFWSEEKHYFDPEPVFAIPYGVIATHDEGEHDIDEIAPGFTRSADEDGMIVLEVNVEGPHLAAIYGELLKVHSRYEVFWYRLHDFWEDATTQLLVSDLLDTPEAILAHLADHEHDSLQNGYVTLTAYLEEGRTNLNLTEHKQITIYTYSEDLAKRYAEALNGLGYPEMDELVSFEFGIYHWHFRHPDSRTRSQLIEHLKEAGFRDWDPNSGDQE
ncbi:hypothetical protein [Haloferula sp. BvORR071]|uniref:hypothetical protein n=1 Tax=Haloferula sp. BvORR071 TaxID=1396141 RepID=UPI00054E2675|nr:hypothetical protein [Haloferula sp. BvORR071]